MKTSNPRPFGVTIAALLSLAIAIISLLIAARYVLNPAGNQDLILLFTRLKLPVTYLNLLAVPPLLSTGLATLLFRGLWEGRAWSRVAVTFFSFVGMLTALAALAFLQVFNMGGATGLWLAVFAFVIFTFFFVYFIKLPWPDETPAAASSASESPLEPATPATSSPPMPTPAEARPAPDAATVIIAPEMAAHAATAPTVQLDPVPEPVQPLACLTALSGQDQGRHFQLFDTDLLLGRHPTLADVLLTDPTVSARHARLRHEGEGFILYDLESTNGVFVNDQRIQEQSVQDGDEIKLGAVRLLIHIPCQDNPQ